VDGGQGIPGMRDVDGIEATRRIVADPALEATRVVVLTTFEIDEYVFAALRSGASGFLIKDTRPADLLQADWWRPATHCCPPR
jgi:DNA-binding NarL/FixJ family response regulator